MVRLIVFVSLLPFLCLVSAQVVAARSVVGTQVWLHKLITVTSNTSWFDIANVIRAVCYFDFEIKNFSVFFFRRACSISESLYIFLFVKLKHLISVHFNVSQSEAQNPDYRITFTIAM